MEGLLDFVFTRDANRHLCALELADGGGFSPLSGSD